LDNLAEATHQSSRQPKSCTGHLGYVYPNPRTFSHHVHWANLPSYKCPPPIPFQVKTFFTITTTSNTSTNGSTTITLRETTS
ncbi:hypothetical protein PHLCEN_2v154, partial [Hermanssonia centrifuga]